METNYTLEYFIQKFEAIPEKNWCTDVWYRDDACCAIGHCGVKAYVFTEDLNEAHALRDILAVDHVIKVANINDGSNSRYKQPTPKQRILAALYDIKKMQEPKHIDITKELAVLPIQETSDVIATKETILS